MEKDESKYLDEDHEDCHVEEGIITEDGQEQQDHSLVKRPPKQKLEYFEWDEEIEKKCKSIIESQSNVLSQKMYDLHEENARRNWDIFYKRNTTNFYKNRNYIDREFNLPTLVSKLKETKKRRLNLLEAGCGVGNTIFPLAEIFSKDMKVYGFDFSANAIDFIKKNEHYDTNNIEVEVKDLVKSELGYAQIDFVTLVFVLSAISPENHELVIRKLLDCMDSDSYLYFRDYAEFDMAQMRLASKKDTKLKDGFYLKTDGTRVFYFNEKYLRALFAKFGDIIEVERIETHYRKIRNIKRNLEMNRVWVQGVIHKK